MADMILPSDRYCEVCGKRLRADNQVGICKSNQECTLANRRKRRETNLEHEQARELAWRKGKGKREYALLMNARHRAKAAGVPCDLTLDTIPKVPERCPCCEVILDYDGSWHVKPSLDRIVPKRGYVQSNVSWLCRKCNQRKNDFTIAELRRLLSFLEGLGIDEYND